VVTVDDFMTGVGAFMLFAVTLGFWAFILLFHVLSDWRASKMGRHIMSLMGVCAAVLTWSWIGLIFDVPRGVRIWIRLGLYSSLAYVVWHQVMILVKTQVVVRGTPAEVLEGKDDHHAVG
jgi:hypothetical protein